MLREEFIQLRIEARTFVNTVQALPGFGDRLSNLDPAAEVMTWRWAGIKRLLTVPESTSEGLSPGVLTRGEAGALGYEPRPDYDTLVRVDAYAKRVERFAKDLLAGVSWGPRAVHDAVRVGLYIELPRSRPEKLIRVGTKRTGGAATYSELEAIVNANRPRRELRGSREATWAGAIKAVRTRLDGGPVSTGNRRHLTNARRYLEGAVNRELPAIGQAATPVEPTDHPLWEAHVSQRTRDRNTSP